MSNDSTLYSRLGGRETISTITNNLFSQIIADPELSKYWECKCEDGINKNKEYLLDYLCSSTGGPEHYTGRDNKTAHKDMGITQKDWLIFITYVADTLDRHKVPSREREEILDLFESTKTDIVETGEASVKKESLFEKIGSLSKVQELTSEFYDTMEKEPFAKELRDLHPKNLFMSKKALAKFITHWLGGPELFGEQYVNITWLELRHRRFELSERNKQQWLHCMNIAMTNVGIEDDLKNELNQKFSTMIESMQLQRAKKKS